MNRLKAIADIRKKLISGGSSIGSWMQIPHSSIAEIMGQSNYDWIAVDMEHGAISVHQLPDLFRALELGNTLPLVRIIREKHPNTPIIFIENIIFESGYLDSTIKNELNNKNIELKYQYNKMLREGIINLFYIDNKDAIGTDHEGTVDGVHFTDLGFLRYADYLINNFHKLGVLDLN